MARVVHTDLSVVRDDAGVAHPDPAKGSTEGTEKQSEGLSQFISKVLDQLSLSAWLPAAMLVGCGAILVQLRTQGTFDLGAALIALAAKPLGILIVLLFAMVLATLVSQAFSFTAIRFLEGYWRGPFVTLGLYSLLVRRKLNKQRKLTENIEKASQGALEAALYQMRSRNVPRYIIHIIEENESDASEESIAWSPQQLNDAAAVDWRIFCPPEKLGRISQLKSALADYPLPHRMMPTKLGNILRATEDAISQGGGETEGLMLRRGESITPRLRQHHDQFRTRLDMYCTLVFVQFALAALTIALLVPTGISATGTAVTASFFTILAATSYSAAIASARGYCSILRIIFGEEGAGSATSISESS